MDYKREGTLHRFWFDTAPVPASRPRVSKFGTYYGKRYKQFRKDFSEEVAEFRMGFRPLLADRLRVTVVFCVPQPKTTKLRLPRGDIDNYLKALFDGCNELVWRDDVQIAEVEASKIWSDEGLDNEGYITLDVEVLDDESEPRA
jgi:Holliday junction resolvase RusA-like endonuclease